MGAILSLKFLNLNNAGLATAHFRMPPRAMAPSAPPRYATELSSFLQLKGRFLRADCGFRFKRSMATRVGSRCESSEETPPHVLIGQIK
ncbi:hypothetical protein TNCV_1848071 [Trichonephila clavipes]|nr:hypothetical protein TNCV_1848071 [Trichonephila clavipes]